nr:MAG TPA: hypothetical protein [Caudoviricetes sp.]
MSTLIFIFLFFCMMLYYISTDKCVLTRFYSWVEHFIIFNIKRV